MNEPTKPYDLYATLGAMEDPSCPDARNSNLAGNIHQRRVAAEMAAEKSAAHSLFGRFAKIFKPATLLKPNSNIQVPAQATALNRNALKKDVPAKETLAQAAHNHLKHHHQPEGVPPPSDS